MCISGSSPFGAETLGVQIRLRSHVFMCTYERSQPFPSSVESCRVAAPRAACASVPSPPSTFQKRAPLFSSRSRPGDTPRRSGRRWVLCHRLQPGAALCGPGPRRQTAQQMVLVCEELVLPVPWVCSGARVPLRKRKQIDLDGYLYINMDNILWHSMHQFPTTDCYQSIVQY